VSLLRHCRSLLARPHLRLIALVGVIVPRRLRADWRQEWEAELQHRETLLADWARLDWRTKLDLVRRSTSAFWDAIWQLHPGAARGKAGSAAGASSRMKTVVDLPMSTGPTSGRVRSVEGLHRCDGSLPGYVVYSLERIPVSLSWRKITLLF
jgi:hypothetical protein